MDTLPSTEELKRSMIQSSVDKLIGTYKVPATLLLQALRKIESLAQQHQSEMDAHAGTHEEFKGVMDSHKEVLDAHARQIQEWDQIVRHLITIDHLRGEPGQDADENAIHDRVMAKVIPLLPTKEDVVSSLIPHLPQPKPGLPGKDATPIDETKLIKKVITHIQKNKSLDVSDIRNTNQFFTKDGVKYYFEELMHGGGGKSTGGSSTPFVPTGVVNAVNTVFGVTAEPSSVVSDGITYFEGSGYSYSGGQITMIIAPSQYIRYYK